MERFFLGVVLTFLLVLLYYSIIFYFRFPPWKKVPKPIVLIPRKGTFNWKIRQRMKYDTREFLTTYSDKLKVREYVKKKVPEIKLAPIIIVIEDPERIPFDRLPKSFAIKATHGSGWNILIKDGINICTGKPVDHKRIIKNLKKWKNKQYGHFFFSNEPHYWKIPPRFIIEEFLAPFEGHHLPKDYKFYVFNGKIHSLEVHSGRFEKDHACNVYDKNWNPMNIMIGDPISESKDEKPKHFDLMKKYAERLAENIDFVRVDLYEINGEIYFGELSFTPGGGFTRFVPARYDNIYGDMWQLGFKIPGNS